MTLTPGGKPLAHTNLQESSSFLDDIFHFQMDMARGIEDPSQFQDALSTLNKLKTDPDRPSYVTAESIDQAIEYIQKNIMPLASTHERMKAIEGLVFPPPNPKEPWQQDIIHYRAALTNIDFNITEPKGYNDAIAALKQLKKDGFPSATTEEIDDAIEILEQIRDIPIDPRFPQAGVMEKQKQLGQLQFPPSKTIELE